MTDIIDTEMARILRQARVDAGLTQLEVANYLGVARWTYHRAETGYRDFSSDWVRRLPLSMQRPIASYLETVLLLQAAEMSKIARRVRRPSGAVALPLAALDRRSINGTLGERPRQAA